MIDEDLAKELKEGWSCLMIREVPSRGVCGIIKYAYTHGVHSQMDGKTYYGRWCYRDLASATSALLLWDGAGDPPGDWLKYKGKDCERHPPGYKEPWEK